MFRVGLIVTAPGHFAHIHSQLSPFFVMSPTSVLSSQLPCVHNVSFAACCPQRHKPLETVLGGRGMLRPPRTSQSWKCLQILSFSSLKMSFISLILPSATKPSVESLTSDCILSQSIGLLGFPPLPIFFF